MNQTFTTPQSDRFFEDYTIGATYDCGSVTVSEAEIIGFAKEYDPQVMHIDPVAAAQGPFGEVIASGWHTIGLVMRLYVDTFLPFNGLAAPGIDELRWPLPVRPGDTLSVTVTVLDGRRSRSKPDRGLLNLLIEARNQKDQPVLSLKPMNFIRTRHPAPEA